MIIERPNALQIAMRILRWEYNIMEPGKEPILLRDTPRPVLQHLANLGAKAGGPSGLNTYAKCTHCMHGVQFSISSDVSQELELSTLSCEPKDIALPAKSVEFLWQDRGLPAVLMTDFGGNLVFVIDTRRGQDNSWIFISHPTRLQKILNPRHKNDTLKQVAEIDGIIKDDDQDALEYMVLLCLKVLAFIQTAQAKATPIKTNAERKLAGLLEAARKRPERPTTLIRYLPRQLVPSETTKTGGDGSKRAFKGRIGHIRHFNSEFFTHARGTWKAIRPILPPAGVEVVYKIRKAAPTP